MSPVDFKKGQCPLSLICKSLLSIFSLSNLRKRLCHPVKFKCQGPPNLTINIDEISKLDQKKTKNFYIYGIYRGVIQCTGPSLMLCIALDAQGLGQLTYLIQGHTCPRQNIQGVKKLTGASLLQGVVRYMPDGLDGLT